MPAPANLVHQTSTGTGTGNLTLVAVNGKQSFSDAFGTGGSDVFDYFISNQDASEWERGTGSMSDATTLVRDTVIESTNSDAAVNFSAGTKDVTNDVPADNQITSEDNASAGEINTGTSTAKFATPDALAGSYAGTKSIQMVVFDFGTAVSTGDGAFYFHVPSALAGMNLVAVHAEVITAGTTGTTDIQIHNVTDAVDMLSTKLTIDSGETGSDTAATAAVINTSNDDVAENDLLRIDVDAVSTTPPNGLIVTMEYRLP